MNEQKVILTSQDYFDAVLFDRQALEDKIAYLLFYVTCIAGLRKDMTAKILADRLADLYQVYNIRTSLKMGEKLEYIGEAKIKEILASRHDYFAASSGIIDYSDRKKNECAYCLSKNKFNELQAEFDTRIKKRITVFDQYCPKRFS